MREVTFLGLYNKDVKNLSGEIWTLNDWFRVFPKLNPARVYQIHWEFSGEHPTDPGRFKDWRRHYEDSGAEIVVTSDLGFSRQRFFDTDRALKEWPAADFQSTMSCMLLDAIWEGVDVVNFEGIALLGDEYTYQVPALLRNIDATRAAGVRVNAPREQIWRDSISTVDWSNIHEIAKPYWMQ